MTHRRWIGILVVIFAALSGEAALGQTACCLPGGDCQNVAGMSGCNALGGVLLDGQDCVDDPCASGACCTGLSCSEIDAFTCIAGGRDFIGAGVPCADDPCAIGSGACCTGGACQQLVEEDCLAGGGTFVGPGTICAVGPCQPGSCCLPGDCVELPQFECNAAGGSFIGGTDCLDFLCTLPPLCSEDALYAQSVSAPDSFTAGVSEVGTGVQRFDDFSGVAGAVQGLTWWGLDLDFVVDQFQECTEPLNQFHISFHDSEAGLPGAAVCSYTLTAGRTELPILYEGFQLNEYNVTLPDTCPLTQGWVSIVGSGDPQCWFLWMSSDQGNGASYCDNCDPQVEAFDLGVCLTGTPGGAGGACCDLSSGMCADDVDIAACAATGQRFVAGTMCVDLDPACTATVGACCDAAGNCSIDLPADCLAAGGTWLGADTTCDQCPSIGACCIDAGECFITSESDCLGSGFTWGGQASTCAQCPEAPTCGPDAMVSQPPDGPSSSFLAGTSEASTAFARFENFSGVAEPIEALTWWGLDMINIDGTFIECVDPDPTFELSFHADAAGQPGTVLCSHTLSASSMVVGFSYFGAQLNEYRVTLPAPCVLDSGWVRIVGLGDPDCWFLWMSSPAGDGASYCDGCAIPEEVFDFSLCLSAILCPADLDGNGIVDASDLATLLGSWGPCPQCPADLTGDGDVGASDLAQVLGAWGPC